MCIAVLILLVARTESGSKTFVQWPRGIKDHSFSLRGFGENSKRPYVENGESESTGKELNGANGMLQLRGRGFAGP